MRIQYYNHWPLRTHLTNLALNYIACNLRIDSNLLGKQYFIEICVRSHILQMLLLSLCLQSYYYFINFIITLLLPSWLYFSLFTYTFCLFTSISYTEIRQPFSYIWTCKRKQLLWKAVVMILMWHFGQEPLSIWLLYAFIQPQLAH